MTETNDNKKNCIGTWYERWIDKWIPQYGVLSLISCFLLNSCVYSGTQIFMKNFKHYDLTTDWDRAIPFVKEWIVVYLGCFLFWAINYILITREGKEKWFRFATADMMSRLVCCVFFIFLPTINVRPEVIGNDFFSVMVRFMYGMDDPVNLFPSIHCLVSWFCFIGIRKSEKIPKWYKIFSCIFALLVCVSTQYLKQHYLIDIIGGIALAEICYYITTHTNIYLGVEKFFDSLGKTVFYRRWHE